MGKRRDEAFDSRGGFEGAGREGGGEGVGEGLEAVPKGQEARWRFAAAFARAGLGDEAAEE